MNRRVVVTGIGIVSSLGSDVSAVDASLRAGRCGIVRSADMERMGFRSRVYAPVAGFDPSVIPRPLRLTASPASLFAMVAAKQAVEGARLTPAELSGGRCGAVIGTCFSGVTEAYTNECILAAGKPPSRAGASTAVKAMNSGPVAHVAVQYGLRGRVFSLSSAFASGVDDIGSAYDLIRRGTQDVMLAGSCEGPTWQLPAIPLDNAQALSSGYNDLPDQACRPYDLKRSGLVLSEGAGVVVLEEATRARARGAPILGEVIGYGSANDGADMFRPSGDGLDLAIGSALAGAAACGAPPIAYIKTHGTGTALGDQVEIAVLRRRFGEGPLVSSTKGYSGHSLGACGAQEAIYALLMLQGGYAVSTRNLQELDPLCAGVRHVPAGGCALPPGPVLMFNVGFGGTNAALVINRCEESP
jgi:3-oxoacyl-[acyl-carrier-protein] synthase-1